MDVTVKMMFPVVVETEGIRVVPVKSQHESLGLNSLELGKEFQKITKKSYDIKIVYIYLQFGREKVGIKQRTNRCMSFSQTFC